MVNNNIIIIIMIFYVKNLSPSTNTHPSTAADTLYDTIRVCWNIIIIILIIICTVFRMFVGNDRSGRRRDVE